MFLDFENVSERKPSIVLEVCVDSLESALAAVKGGADRLEICGNLSYGGGSTPSIGLVKAIKKACPDHVELMAMVRPRVGDFIYTPEELDVMSEDISAFADAGVTGIVLGVLQVEGVMSVQSTQALAEKATAKGLIVCFHRAFDMVVDQQEALISIAQNIPGVTRILTSGGSPSAPKAVANLAALLNVSNSEICTVFSSANSGFQDQLSSSGRKSIEIMPGSGVNATTAKLLLNELIPLGLRSVHMSGGKWISGQMRFRKAGMGMGAAGQVGDTSTAAATIGEEDEVSLKEWGKWQTSVQAVRAVREIADEEWTSYVEGVKTMSK